MLALVFVCKNPELERSWMCPQVNYIFLVDLTYDNVNLFATVLPAEMARERAAMCTAC